MIRFIKSLYLSERLFYALFGIAGLFLLSFWWHFLYSIAWELFVALCLLVFVEIVALYSAGDVKGERTLPEKFSNSDENRVELSFQNKYAFSVLVGIIEELPFQFQKRDFYKKIKIKGKSQNSFTYQLRPVERGEYYFGKLNMYVKSSIGLVQRRFTFGNQQMVKVYPSFLQMKKYDFLAIDNRISSHGFKKTRRLGHTMEFEQIKEYVSGDDIRTLNWKATAKRGDLMINQFQEEKAQPIYSIINTGRVMKMPFEGLSLLDYAINSSLAFSNIGLKKNDKIGLLSFSNAIGQHLPASSRKSQLNKVLESLYNINTAFLETDYELLYTHVKRKINQRSLLLLYTNFEHISALQRQLPFLKAIAKKHVLVVIFFENTELDKLVNEKFENIPGIYHQTIAHQFEQDKHQMVQELKKNGIQTVLSKPKELTVSTINKYFEIKNRGLL